ncbi:MAG TPA: hypothetical protein VFF19_16990 [Reyranella sp.]|nr:hypothetical protein [Reyranella sp.]
METVPAAIIESEIADLASHSAPRSNLDFLTRSCGLSSPTLFERIGIMAADGRPLQTSFPAVRLNARPSEFVLSANNPSSGPPVKAGRPVKKPPTAIASGPTDWQVTAIRMKVGKVATGPKDPANTTPTVVASGPAHAASRVRLDNRIRMVVAKRSSRLITTHHFRRQGMSARAGPFS